MLNITTLTPSSGNVVEAADAMTAARIDGGAEVSVLFAGYVAAATRLAEHLLDRVLLTRSVRIEQLDWGVQGGPRKGLYVTISPVQEVLQVQWYDGAAWQVLAAPQYELLMERAGCRIVPALGVVWPTLAAGDGYRVRVDVRVGMASAGADVPENIKLFITAQAAYWFRHPAAATEAPMQPAPNVERLLDIDRSWLI